MIRTTQSARTSRRRATAGLARAVVLFAAVFAATAGADAEMSVNFFAVGPGNCVVIDCPNSNANLMIDCGSNLKKEDRGSISQAIVDITGANPTNLILTHPDQDHYNWINDAVAHGMQIQDVYAGGAFKNYSVGNVDDTIRRHANGTIYGQDWSLSSAATVIPAQTVRDRRGNNVTLKAVTGQTFQSSLNITAPGLCGDAEVVILSGNAEPNNLAYETNGQSLVTAVTYAGRTFIFPGDATNTTATHALRTALDRWAAFKGVTLSDYTSYRWQLDVDFLMAPHHGSSTEGSNWDGWSRVTSPDYVIFSGDPTMGQISLRHPREAGYDPYRNQLRDSDGVAIPLSVGDPDDSGSLARAKRLTVYEAALGLWDTMDLTVHVFADGNTAIWCPRQSICGGELHNWVPMDLD